MFRLYVPSHLVHTSHKILYPGTQPAHTHTSEKRRYQWHLIWGAHYDLQNYNTLYNYHKMYDHYPKPNAAPHQIHGLKRHFIQISYTRNWSHTCHSSQFGNRNRKVARTITRAQERQKEKQRVFGLRMIIIIVIIISATLTMRITKIIAFDSKVENQKL